MQHAWMSSMEQLALLVLLSLLLLLLMPLELPLVLLGVERVWEFVKRESIGLKAPPNLPCGTSVVHEMLLYEYDCYKLCMYDDYDSRYYDAYEKEGCSDS